MRPHPLSLALIAANAIVSCVPAHAASGVPSEDVAADDARLLDRVVVVATRTERAIVDVPNTVDEIDRARMDELLVHDLKDLFRYEPGISVGSSFGRFGIGDIRIRGLGGNRVRIQTDGIAAPDAFSIGSFSNANRNFTDLDTLKRVEVVRGPTSSLYGSDALGGTVSFVTKDPSDYLKAGKDAYFGFKLGVDGEWDGLSAGATAAFGGERWSGMLAIGRRQGQATHNQGDADAIGAARTAPNPQDRAGGSVLGKLVFAPSANQRFKLTVERNEDHADTEMLTSVGYQSLTRATNTRVAARDDQQRERVSFAHDIDLWGAFADAIDWQVYRQDSKTTQYTIEERLLPAPTLHDVRERWFDFGQRTTGLQANFRKSLGETATHDIAWGFDFARTETEQRRDGLRHYPLTGASTSNMAPDNFPVRDFPLSTTTNAALYVQNEIGLAGGKLRLVPALRVDRYELEPENDAIFAADNPGVALADLTKTSVSPKFGAVWRLGVAWSLFGGYARGFRAPPYADVNIGFTNVQFGYTAIANPDLKPETSDGFELGLRYSGSAAYASLSGYDNRYRDFIESFVFAGFNAQGLMVFQSQNVADARIRGVELKAGVDLGAVSGAWDGWSLRGAAAWSRGEDRTADEPLESVDPLSATLGIAHARGAWGVELAGRFAARRDRMPDASVGTSYFQSPGYGVFDLYAHWNIAEQLRLDVGIANLADRKYWAAGDIPLVSSASTTLDRNTAPGRSISASVSFDW
jgi:hemoglobin/transferrin/lactoferrin receptor protein